MANPYRELFSAPGAIGLVITSAIARLPQAMIGIGIITMLVQQTGPVSYTHLTLPTICSV